MPLLLLTVVSALENQCGADQDKGVWMVYTVPASAGLQGDRVHRRMVLFDLPGAVSDSEIQEKERATVYKGTKDDIVVIPAGCGRSPLARRRASACNRTRDHLLAVDAAGHAAALLSQAGSGSGSSLATGLGCTAAVMFLLVVVFGSLYAVTRKEL